MTTPDLAGHVAAVRRFNRFYTKLIGALDEGHLKSPFSLTEVRVLYELAHQDQVTARDLAIGLNLDPGYLSRILQRFTRQKLITHRRASHDARQRLLTLTPLGRRTFAPLNTHASEEIERLLGKLGPADQERVTEAMHTIENQLGGREEAKVPYILRPPGPGDLGWVVQRHGATYAEEYNWNAEFEGLVAGIVADFAKGHDSTRERCWIAERDEEPVGCVFIVKGSATVARLRLLLVEPAARGLGIGSRLVNECVRFARQAGYRKLTLWSNSVLKAARHIYEKAGFQITHRERHHSFGQQLVGETWELKL
jgi:DNA-binding MarR family transcriptional regulator/N-acetylglutamate synthase-like GNAT family acetyltransferase